MDTSNLSDDAKDKLDNLADDETKAQFYDMEDIENYANGKTKITAEQAQELQQMTGMFTDKADEIVSERRKIAKFYDDNLQFNKNFFLSLIKFGFIPTL